MCIPLAPLPPVFRMCPSQVFEQWHARKRSEREAKRAAELEDRKKKVGGGLWAECRQREVQHRAIPACLSVSLSVESRPMYHEGLLPLALRGTSL